MKKNLTTLLGLILLSLSTMATVSTVSNNPNSPGQYSDLQAAIDGSTNGDTLYIHGSPNNYGTIYLNRSLTLIGPGYNPQKDLPLVAQLQYLILDSVAGIKGCSGSNILGLKIDYLQHNSSSSPFNNILIKFNKVYQLNFSPTSANNVVIAHNLFDYIYSIQHFNNLVLRNNIVYNTISYFQNNTSVLVSNNLFYYVTLNTGIAMQDFATISNNIFVNVHPNSNFSTYNNNLIFNSGSDVLPYGNNTGSGNFNGSIPLFVNAPDYNGINLNYDYHLTTASPGHNGGTDGTDIGPFGGIDPLVDLTGTPPVPQIKIFNINNTVVLPNTPLDIYVKAKKQ